MSQRSQCIYPSDFWKQGKLTLAEGAGEGKKRKNKNKKESCQFVVRSGWIVLKFPRKMPAAVFMCEGEARETTG